jgi:hypothetical protein
MVLFLISPESTLFVPGNRDRGARQCGEQGYERDPMAGDGRRFT